MVSTKLFIVVMAVMIGSIATLSLNTVSADYQNIGIAPTDALQTINVQTSPWAVSDTLVVAEQYDETFYFVSDGSVIFNVTESYP